MPAIIHVKLSGEGDFGPVDLECAIPPARLPVVMAALFGQAPAAPGMAVGAVRGSVPGVSGGGRPRENGEVDGFANEGAGARWVIAPRRQPMACRGQASHIQPMDIQAMPHFPAQ